MNKKRQFRLIGRQTTAVGLIISLLLSAVPGSGAHDSERNGMSHGAKGVVKGGLGGAALGALIGAAAGDAGKGAAIGAASGIVIGGIAGHSKDQKERAEERQQARIAAERAHEREIQAIRKGEYLESEEWNEDVVVIEGYPTVEEEVREAERRADASESRLKELQAEVADAEERGKALEEAEARRVVAEEKIRELEALRKTLDEEEESAN